MRANSTGGMAVAVHSAAPKAWLTDILFAIGFCGYGASTLSVSGPRTGKRARGRCPLFSGPPGAAGVTGRGFSDTCQGGHRRRHNMLTADVLLLAPSPLGRCLAISRSLTRLAAKKRPSKHSQRSLSACLQKPTSRFVESDPARPAAMRCVSVAFLRHNVIDGDGADLNGVDHNRNILSRMEVKAG